MKAIAHLFSGLFLAIITMTISPSVYAYNYGHPAYNHNNKHNQHKHYKHNQPQPKHYRHYGNHHR